VNGEWSKQEKRIGYGFNSVTLCPCGLRTVVFNGYPTARSEGRIEN